MENRELLDKLENLKLVPVVAIEDADDAVALADALIAGGLPVAEITFRTAAAEDAIRRITEARPEMIVGAGTVLTTEQADRAIAAGACFIVSPGFNPKVVAHVLSKGVSMVPGINNPTGIEAALEQGLSVVKFFPAEASGGLNMLKAMAAPYGDVRFMPTGGINANNIGEYLANPRVLACGGSWIVRKDLIASGKFEEITRLTKEALNSIRNA